MKIISCYSINEHVRESDYENLDVLPSKMGYRHLDLDLDDGKHRTDSLRRSLKELKKDYDLVVIDCPPNITLLSENVFNASDLLLIPIIHLPGTQLHRSQEWE